MTVGLIWRAAPLGFFGNWHKLADLAQARHIRTHRRVWIELARQVHPRISLIGLAARLPYGWLRLRLL